MPDLSDHINAYKPDAARDLLETGFQVSLHLGAHKTATTYIQRRLAQNRDALAEVGTAVLLPEHLREPLGLKLPSQAYETAENIKRTHIGQDKISALLEETAAQGGMQRITLSEEAYLGSCRNNLARSSLYPDAALRLEVLPPWLDHPNVTVFFCLRAYASFFSSNLTTAMRRGHMFQRPALARHLLRSKRRWRHVVRDLRNAFPNAKLRVWRYEDFRSVENDLFSEMTGHSLTQPDTGKRAMETLSAQAVRWLERQERLGKFEAAPRRRVRQAKRRFPVGDAHPAFELFGGEAKTELELRYIRDWNAIQQEWPEAILTA